MKTWILTALALAGTGCGGNPSIPASAPAETSLPQLIVLPTPTPTPAPSPAPLSCQVPQAAQATVTCTGGILGNQTVELNIMIEFSQINAESNCPIYTPSGAGCFWGFEAESSPNGVVCVSGSVRNGPYGTVYSQEICGTTFNASTNELMN